jgi:hypothetical protein
MRKRVFQNCVVTIFQPRLRLAQHMTLGFALGQRAASPQSPSRHASPATSRATDSR